MATNAGGLRYLRYGSLRGTVLGMEAVLADGTVLDNLSALRKDNTGYDLKNLFIGSEGTLGVITKCALALPPLPRSVQLALIGVDSYEAVLQTFLAARSSLAEVLSAVEFIDAEAFAVATGVGGARPPLEAVCRHYVLVELHGSNAAHDEEKLSAFLESVLQSGAVVDGTIARDEAQSRAIWAVREGITPALSKSGYVYKYDLSLGLSEMYELVEEMRGRLARLDAQMPTQVAAFGHLGDGNLHLNVTTPGKFERDERVSSAVEPFVYEWVAARRGSISAEHGIGAMKPGVLHMSKPAAAIEIMRGLKAMLDPNAILNPGKVLPPL